MTLICENGVTREMTAEEEAEFEAAQANQPRRLIPKSVVQERLNEQGKLDDAFAILQATPLHFGRWFAPNHPNVYFDDEGLLAVLTAIGADIEATTAPV